MLQLKDVVKQFADQVVLRHVDWHVRPTDRIGLCGENGAGKTTLLRLLSGQSEVDAGNVQLARGTTIGYLPQEPLFSGERTIIEEMHAGFESILAIQKRMLALGDKLGRLSGTELEAAMKEYDRLHHEFEKGPVSASLGLF